MNAPTNVTARKEVSETASDANGRFYDALNRFFQGDFAAMDMIWSQSDDVILSGPWGGRQVGWRQVRDELKRECDLKIGGRLQATDVNAVVTDDLAVFSCWERGNMPGENGTQIAISQRATNVFRKESGGWKLIGRQTDVSRRLQGSGEELDLSNYGLEGCDD